VKAEPHPGEVEFVPAIPPGSRLGRPWRRFMRRLKGWPNLEGLQQAGLTSAATYSWPAARTSTRTSAG
jgi:hypothetical protein